tara:strand:- start:1416 stop:2714 length:1299 start_codon:yes stop_codon:yes gene_type:complete
MKDYFIKNILIKYNHILVLIGVIIITTISAIYYNNYKNTEIKKIDKSLKNIYLKKTLSSLLSSTNPRFLQVNYKVKIADNFSKILDTLDVSLEEKNKVLKTISKSKKINKLTVNQNIYFKLDKAEPSKVIEFRVPISKTKNLYFVRDKLTDKFDVNEVEKILNKKIVYKESKITSSLYASAINQGIKTNIIIEFARIYGFQVDFQRDIYKNDSFQIIYEIFKDEKDKLIETGNILFANLILQGKEYPLYFFDFGKSSDHFDESGQSIRKTLMKTPINGARLSSPFGMRKHPILGFNKMHKGTDFAAPMGTPVMASGDGTVKKAGWCGGGGNCVKIKHNSTYSTVYAHLSKFGRGIKKNVKVKQGQVIGYVGSTGMSTGPHLHYEVIENGRKVNSQKLKLPSGKVLKGEERKSFEISKIKTNVLKSELIAALN